MNDPVTQHIGHLKDFEMNLLVSGDVGRVVIAQTSGRLLERQVEMRFHHRLHFIQRPKFGIGRVQESGDIIGVFLPESQSLLKGIRVPALGSVNHVDGDQNVIG